MISIIIPVYNEEDNIMPLYEQLYKVLTQMDLPFEVIFVNDGSQDRSEENLIKLTQYSKDVKLVNLKRNFGQTAAIVAGIDHAVGEIIIGMDADLQNDPTDIARLLEKLNEGYDVVSGWRKERSDNRIKRVWLSRMANKIVSKISGVNLHDYGCTLKAYRRDTIKAVKLYGEMHRFIPIFASWQGARITEIPVKHHPRVSGESKYGLERVVKVILDLVVIKFLADYQTRPMYIFGGFGLISFLIGSLSAFYALYLKLFEGVSFILTPLPLIVVMTSIIGGLSILIGLIADIIMRAYFEIQNKPPYIIKNTVNFN